MVTAFIIITESVECLLVTFESLKMFPGLSMKLQTLIMLNLFYCSNNSVLALTVDNFTVLPSIVLGSGL